MQTATPARLYALLVGGALALLGVVGFFYDASFGSGSTLASDDLAGVFAVNGWHNLVHLATGLAGLALASRAARSYALGLGAAYTVIAIWGMLETDHGIGTLLNLIPVGSEDNLLHIVIGLTGLAAWAGSRPARAAAAHS